jgi:predicted DsbA family dithiol-disulfide isomerase
VTAIEIRHFTDPACPFAFSHEPIRWRLRWHYGDGLAWQTTLIVLTREPGEAEKLAEGAPGLGRRYGMPVLPHPYERAASSEPACRAAVAARLYAPGAEEPLLRALRVLTHSGGLLDDPQLIAEAAREAGIDPVELARWSEGADVVEALEQDARAARSPSAGARALDHKLGGPRTERRYSAPSYELRRAGSDLALSLPGFNPVEAYEAAIASLAPELERRPRPGAVEELLDWAGVPLATAEVALVAQLEMIDARAALARVAIPQAAGADCYWRLP